MCQEFTNAIDHILKFPGYWLMNYIDDLPRCETTKDVVDEAFYFVAALLHKLGVEKAEDKTIVPSIRC